MSSPRVGNQRVGVSASCPVTDNTDSGGQVDVIYTDFAKAFDTVPKVI